MKLLRMAGIGITIWGLTLVWVEVNLALRLSVIGGLILAWAAVWLIDILAHRLMLIRSQVPSKHDRPTRPVPVAASR
jgi:hypothetical protein